jgi:hypothetical protein
MCTGDPTSDGSSRAYKRKAIPIKAESERSKDRKNPTVLSLSWEGESEVKLKRGVV